LVVFGAFIFDFFDAAFCVFDKKEGKKRGK
jgi:hypothetical protein